MAAVLQINIILSLSCFSGYNRAHADIAEEKIRKSVEDMFCLLTTDESAINEMLVKVRSMGLVGMITMSKDEFTRFLTEAFYRNVEMGERLFNSLSQLNLVSKAAQDLHQDPARKKRREYLFPSEQALEPLSSGGCACKKDPHCLARCSCAKAGKACTEACRCNIYNCNSSSGRFGSVNNPPRVGPTGLSDDEDDAVGGGGAVRAGHGHHRLAAYRRERAEEYRQCEKSHFGIAAARHVR